MASTSFEVDGVRHSFSGSLLKSFRVSTSILTLYMLDTSSKTASGGVARSSSYAPITDCFNPSFSANCFWVSSCLRRRYLRFLFTIVMRYGWLSIVNPSGVERFYFEPLSFHFVHSSNAFQAYTTRVRDGGICLSPKWHARGLASADSPTPDALAVRGHAQLLKYMSALQQRNVKVVPHNWDYPQFQRAMASTSQN